MLLRPMLPESPDHAHSIQRVTSPERRTSCLGDVFCLQDEVGTRQLCDRSTHSGQVRRHAATSGTLFELYSPEYQRIEVGIRGAHQVGRVLAQPQFSQFDDRHPPFSGLVASGHGPTGRRPVTRRYGVRRITRPPRAQAVTRQVACGNPLGAASATWRVAVRVYYRSRIICKGMHRTDATAGGCFSQSECHLLPP
jgi:hypothetical protein